MAWKCCFQYRLAASLLSASIHAFGTYPVFSTLRSPLVLAGRLASRWVIPQCEADMSAGK